MSNNKIALLIDAENVSEKYIKYILDEVSNYGIPTYKRIYGDWTTEQSKKWKWVLLTYSITPVQQYNYTLGKNSSDSALIIDAMDILYTNSVQGFCIVSSDSDFTRLAARLREAGMLVIGMGEKKTPKALISACEKFIYLEVLLPQEEKKLKLDKLPDTKYDKFIKKPEKIVKEQKPELLLVKDVPIEDSLLNDNLSVGFIPISEIKEAIKLIINEVSNDDGVASLADIGNALSRRFPEFDSRNYGFFKFSQFIESLNGFEMKKQRPADHPGIVHIYVKNKP